MDLNYIYFTNKNFKYVIYDTYFAAGNKQNIGIKIIDLKTSKTTNIKGGRKALVDFFSKFSKPQPIVDSIKSSVVAIIAEGDLVMLSFVREMPDPVDTSKKYTTTWFDLFRIENGKIAEHTGIVLKR